MKSYKIKLKNISNLKIESMLNTIIAIKNADQELEKDRLVIF